MNSVVPQRLGSPSWSLPLHPHPQARWAMPVGLNSGIWCSLLEFQLLDRVSQANLFHWKSASCVSRHIWITPGRLSESHSPPPPRPHPAHTSFFCFFTSPCWLGFKCIEDFLLSSCFLSVPVCIWVFLLHNMGSETNTVNVREKIPSAERLGKLLSSYKSTELSFQLLSSLVSTLCGLTLVLIEAEWCCCWYAAMGY